MTGQVLPGLRIAGAEGHLDFRVSGTVSPGPEDRRESRVTRG